MAIYAIGDVQGCCDELQQLLDELNIDPAADELWFVGDLVNRGPRSADVLRLVHSLGKSAVVTLGNHDLHLIALAYGHGPDKQEDQLTAVLEETDGEVLIDWLRNCPLIHYRPDLNTMMVHAGIPMQWDPLLSVKLAREVEAAVSGDDCDEFLADMYGELPDVWDPELRGNDRLRLITNSLTRIRFCDELGRMDLKPKGPPDEQTANLTPWFDLPNRAADSVRIVFGHWSAIGLVQRKNLLGLDTGCVWGGQLTAARLDGPTRIYQVHSSQPRRF